MHKYSKYWNIQKYVYVWHCTYLYVHTYTLYVRMYFLHTNTYVHMYITGYIHTYIGWCHPRNTHVHAITGDENNFLDWMRSRCISPFLQSRLWCKYLQAHLIALSDTKLWNLASHALYVCTCVHTNECKCTHVRTYVRNPKHTMCHK